MTKSGLARRLTRFKTEDSVSFGMIGMAMMGVRRSVCFGVNGGRGRSTEGRLGVFGSTTRTLSLSDSMQLRVTSGYWSYCAAPVLEHRGSTHTRVVLEEKIDVSANYQS